jgi:hypothetical protein
VVDPVIITGPPATMHVAVPEESTVAMLVSEEVQVTGRLDCVDGA